MCQVFWNWTVRIQAATVPLFHLLPSPRTNQSSRARKDESSLDCSGCCQGELCPWQVLWGLLRPLLSLVGLGKLSLQANLFRKLHLKKKWVIGKPVLWSLGAEWGDHDECAVRARLCTPLSCASHKAQLSEVCYIHIVIIPTPSSLCLLFLFSYFNPGEATVQSVGKLCRISVYNPEWHQGLWWGCVRSWASLMEVLDMCSLYICQRSPFLGATLSHSEVSVAWMR